jgi:hypothetical protein
MTTAAAQANKNAFIVFHLAALAECENNMMAGYAGTRTPIAMMAVR